MILLCIIIEMNTKINTPSGLAITDVKYNNHNVCLLKDVIFGEPGFIMNQTLFFYGESIK